MTKKEELKKMIDKQYDKKTFDLLSDDSLMAKFLKAKSTIKEAALLKKVLIDNGMTEKVWENVFNEYGPKLVKAGTKGVVRGEILNTIIFNKVKDILMSKGLISKFNLTREQHPNPKLTSELPDFMLEEKATGKILIGMVQLDMWSGGQQINRLDKYVKQFSNEFEDHKLVAVIVKPYNITPNTPESSKTFKLIYDGVKSGILIYPKKLEQTIEEFFKL